MRHICAVSLAVMLAGCATTPMDAGTHYQLIEQQEHGLALRERCCAVISEITARPLQLPQLVTISRDTAVVNTENGPSPAVLFELPERRSRLHVQVFSFGEKKGGSLRLARVTFIRPQYLFLDSGKRSIHPAFSPNVCWGDFDFSSSGVWSRAEIPDGANYVLVSAALSPRSQIIDTRRLRNISPVADAISDEIKAYLRPISFGYSGEFHASIVDSSTARHSECTGQGAPENSTLSAL